jgi:hypothetical protein
MQQSLGGGRRVAAFRTGDYARIADGTALRDDCLHERWLPRFVDVALWFDTVQKDWRLRLATHSARRRAIRSRPWICRAASREERGEN